MERTVPLPPTDNVDIDDETSIKRIAGWLARYYQLGLDVNTNISPLLEKLFNNGTLAKHEPSLNKITSQQASENEDYGIYDFEVIIENFIFQKDKKGITLASADLCFFFQTDACYIRLLYYEDNFVLSRDALIKVFTAIGVKPFFEEDGEKRVSWYEADKIIIDYLKYKKGIIIPSIP